MEAFRQQRPPSWWFLFLVALLFVAVVSAFAWVFDVTYNAIRTIIGW